MEYLSSSFLICILEKFSYKLKQKIIAPKKVYGKTLAAADVIIAAAAITYGLILITKNVKYYPFPELEIKKT